MDEKDRILSQIEKGKPIRVLHVLQRMEAGGTQAFLMNMYRNIDREKVQFDFLVEYKEHQFYDDEVAALGGRIYRASVREDFNLPRFWHFLTRFFEEHNEYTIVHVHAYSIGYFVLKAAERAGVPVRIAHSHDNGLSGHGMIIKKLMKNLYPIHANYFMACSDEAGKYFFENRKYKVIRNAIDVNSFSYDESIRRKVRHSLGYRNDNYVIGNVGRLHFRKNQDFLLDVFAEIKKDKPNAKLLMVGDGPEKNRLLTKAQNLKINEDFTLLSNRHDMPNLYQAMDVFVLPSLYEGLGIVTIEAQAAGLTTFCSEGVASEAKVTPNFHQLSLDKGPSYWATAIRQEPAHQREGWAQSVREHGFDIRENAMNLQQWYLKQIVQN